jgi:hypothetical protein
MVLVQILRPYLGCRPSVVITMYSCKGDHWIHSSSLGLTAVLTGNALHNTRNLATRTLAQVEPFKPSGALQSQTLLTSGLLHHSHRVPSHHLPSSSDALKDQVFVSLLHPTAWGHKDKGQCHRLASCFCLHLRPCLPSVCHSYVSWLLLGQT